MKCSTCGFDAPADMSFCGRCGARLGVACPNCGFENPPSYGFCGKCGKELSAAPAPTPPPQQPLALKPSGSPLTPATTRSSVTPLAGERRIATVILADVYRSTDLMEQLGTEAWVELMNQMLQLLAAEVYRFGGRVDQFRGDGLVAFFGATDAHEDDPERAILAALAMQRSVDAAIHNIDTSPDRRIAAIRPCADDMQRQDIDLKVRVGVNTGEVIVGSVGEAGRHREETAMGGGVALAARMETAAEPGTVLVSANTYHLVETRFEWQPLGEIVVKGISRPLAVYRPLRLIEFAESWSAHDMELPLAMVRSAALASLGGCVEALRGGRGGIALVSGAQGMGKTALLNHARRQSEALRPQSSTGPGSAFSGALSVGTESRERASHRQVVWFASSCRSYDQSTPYAIWTGLLQKWLEAAATETGPDWATLLHRQTELIWGDRADRYRPYLAMLLSLPIEDSLAQRIAYLDAAGLQKQLAEVIGSWVEALAQQGPLVLAFSDLQFADSSSLEVLKHCLPICESAAVLWMASFRPDRTALVWEFRHHVETEYPHRLTSIDLPPLTASESRSLIDQLLGGSTLTPDATMLVAEKAEGNPYYIREIVYALMEQGLVQRDSSGVWQQKQPIRSFDLPGSLRGLLLARIDRLSAEARRVLQIASVIGPLFWRNVLEAVAGDACQIRSALMQLQRGQLIHEQGQEADLGMGYVFAPSLVREVVYDSLLSTQRIAYHRQVAEQLEAMFSPESSRPYHGLLAYHYRQAGDLNKELYYTLGAAAEARRVYANTDALAHTSRALVLLDQIAGQTTDADALRPILELRFEALEARRDIQLRMGNVEAGEADSRALLPLAQQMADDPAFMVDALLNQPAVGNPDTQEDLAAGLRMAQDALGLAQQAGDKRREMYALVSLAQLQQLLKDPSWLESGDQAFELSRQLGDLHMQVGLLLGISDSLGMDDLQHGARYLEEALEISQRLEDRETEARLLAALGPQCERSGDYTRQLTEYEQKRVEIYREIGNRMGEGHALMFCGQIQAIYLGDYENGLALEYEALDCWSELSDRLFPLLRIAQIQTLLGRFDAAWSTLASAHAVIERVLLNIGQAGLSLVEAIMNNTQGAADAALHDIDSAAQHWRQVLDLQATIQPMVTDDQLSRQYQMAAACETAAAHLGLAGCVDDANERAKHQRAALEASEMALNVYRQFGFTQVVECLGEEIMHRHSLALAANGRDDEARNMLAAAYNEMMRKHDLIPTDSPFRRTFLENIALHRQIAAAHRENSQ